MSVSSNRADHVDVDELAKFSRLADEWWNPDGKFRPLHKFNPVRLGYIKRSLCDHFARDFDDAHAFEGLSILDLGCGGGLVCEPLARLGARVTGVDPSATNIEVAKIHADRSQLDIDYRVAGVDMLTRDAARYDVVLALEVVEHVADVTGFLRDSAALVADGGVMLVATINRTARAFMLAIVGAEYVLRWLPRGTHSYDKLVRPGEIAQPLAGAGLRQVGATGMVYNPIFDNWALGQNLDVNYMLAFSRQKGA